MNPIIVTGVGRSGTSAVARVLHETLCICMGHDLPKPTDANPEGSYEDKGFRHLHIQVLNNRIDRETFEERARTLLRQRHAEHTPTEEVWSGEKSTGPISMVPLPGDRWGFKDPRASHLLDFYLDVLDDPGIIICERDLDDVLESWRRVCAGDSKQHRREINARKRSIDEALDDWGCDDHVLRLDMTPHRPTPCIMEQVGQFLGYPVEALEGGA